MREADRYEDDLRSGVERLVGRDLPVNPRTGEYVNVGGRSYRREALGAQWVLEHFPADPD